MTHQREAVVALPDGFSLDAAWALADTIEAKFHASLGDNEGFECNTWVFLVEGGHGQESSVQEARQLVQSISGAKLKTINVDCRLGYGSSLNVHISPVRHTADIEVRSTDEAFSRGWVSTLQDEVAAFMDADTTLSSHVIAAPQGPTRAGPGITPSPDPAPPATEPKDDKHFLLNPWVSYVALPLLLVIIGWALSKFL